MSFGKFKKVQQFQPTRAMKRYAMARAKHGDSITDSELSRQLGISKEIISIWKNKKEGFNEWLDETVSVFKAPIHELLECIAIDRMFEDFRYWEAMAIKHGFVTEKPIQVKAELKDVLIPAVTPEQAKLLLEKMQGEQNGKSEVKEPNEKSGQGDDGVQVGQS